MAIASFPIFFVIIIFHALLLHSSKGTNKTQNAECPEEFPCGSLNNAKRFPFAQSSRPSCGLLMLNCDAKPHPRIQFGRDTYDLDVKERLDSPVLRLSDPKLSDLIDQNSCQSFDRNISFQNSPSITLGVYPLIQLFRCNKSHSNTKTVNDNFHGYERHDCELFTLYYKNPFINGSRGRNLTGENVTSDCSVIMLPRKLDEPNNGSGLFHMLSSEFYVSWILSENCSNCHYKFRGQCSTDRKTNQFNCSVSNGTSSNSPRRWILVAVLAGFGLLVISFIIWFLKKRPNCLSLNISRKTSSDAILDRDREAQSNYFGAPMFSYSELEEATNNFDTSRELGDGGFGTVYHGKLRDGREVAVKRLYEFNRKRVELFINEVEILSRLRQQNLVTLYGCTSRHSHGLLVYEYVANGTVADHLHGKRAKEGLLTWHIRMNISVETAGALAYLHASDVIHRDVKTTNILLDDNFRVKVADFGLSRLFPDNVTHVSTAPQGTPGYVDPEYHECYQLTDKSDVYSFGVVLVELISSMPAVDISRHRHEINLANFAMTKILRGEYHKLIDPFLGMESKILEMATSVAELAFQCLQPEKDLRPTMHEVLATLVQIQKWEFKEDDETNAPPSTEAVILLKKSTEFPASPDSLTDHWMNSSSTSSTSGGYLK